MEITGIMREENRAIVGDGAGELEDVLEIGAVHEQGLLELGVIHRNDVDDG